MAFRKIKIEKSLWYPEPQINREKLLSSKRNQFTKGKFGLMSILFLIFLYFALLIIIIKNASPDSINFANITFVGVKQTSIEVCLDEKISCKLQEDIHFQSKDFMEAGVIGLHTLF